MRKPNITTLRGPGPIICPVSHREIVLFRVPGEILKSASPTTGPLGPGPGDHDTFGATETII